MRGLWQQLPVWFQAGGPAHLVTEEPFMGLALGRGVGGEMEATGVRAESLRVAELWEG